MAAWQPQRHCPGEHFHYDPAEEFSLDEGGHCLQKGDEVIYNEASATVVGFLQHGLEKENRHWLRLRLSSGEEVSVPATSVRAVDETEQQHRRKMWFEAVYEWYGGKEEVELRRRKKAEFERKQSVQRRDKK